MKPLCIYHANCPDGFTAAWAVRRALGADKVDFHPGFYHKEPPNAQGRDVVLVDFSYKRPALEEMAKAARSITILDHHKSAAEDLGPILNTGNIRGVFDMERSGAKIAWDYYLDGKQSPDLVRYVEDMDLWRFALKDSRAVNFAILSWAYDFDTWDRLAEMPAEKLAHEGGIIMRKHFRDLEELMARGVRRMKIGGVEVPALNVPSIFVSDAGHIMAKNAPFAACYYDTADGRVFGLRSAENGMDVAKIAEIYGGGGHKHASGFRRPLGWEGDA